MTNYNFKPIIPKSTLLQDKREKRRKVLEAVRARRKEIYKRFEKKLQLQADKEFL